MNDNFQTSDDLCSHYPFRPEDHEWITVTCCGCQDFFKVPQKCGNRFCPTCGKPRQRRTERRLRSMFELIPPLPYRTFKLVTLTIPNSKTPQLGYKFLTKSFRKLRQRKWWKRIVYGGVFVVEATKGQNGFHIHMHIICQAYMIPVKELRDHWQSITGAHIVDVRSMWNINASRYLTKYLTKVKGSVEFTMQVGLGLKGSRLYQPFGKWHALDLAIPKQTFPCTKCGYSGWITDWDTRSMRTVADGWTAYEEWLRTRSDE